MATRALMMAATMLLGLSGTAHAAPVTTGSFTFNDTDFADTASRVAGSSATPQNVTGGIFSSHAIFGAGDIVQFGFTDNDLFNNAGVDLLIFELVSPPDSDPINNVALATTQNGSYFEATWIEQIAVPSSGGAFLTFDIHGFDLDLLGFAAGVAVTQDLFIKRASNATTRISEIVALNSVTDPTAVVPIPAALPLLASALGIFGFFGWRRRNAVAA